MHSHYLPGTCQMGRAIKRELPRVCSGGLVARRRRDGRIVIRTGLGGLSAVAYLLRW